MTDALTIIASILGGGLIVALISWWQSVRLQKTIRRGRARLIHEDLYRLQSTVARIYYERDSKEEWGEKSWVLVALAEKDDQQDVLAHLDDWRFGTCAGALGWAQYLRGGFGEHKAPTDDELRRIYKRLALGRLAISKSKLTDLKYKRHESTNVVSPGDRKQNEDVELPRTEASAAKREAEEYRRRAAPDDAAEQGG